LDAVPQDRFAGWATTWCVTIAPLVLHSTLLALVFATGGLRIREMIAYGLLLDVGGVLLVSAWVTLFA
jgi:hypothetical protein